MPLYCVGECKGRDLLRISDVRRHQLVRLASPNGLCAASGRPEAESQYETPILGFLVDPPGRCSPSPMASGDPLVRRYLFGLDLFKRTLHGKARGLDVASREEFLDNLQRHHRIRPLGSIWGWLLRRLGGFLVSAQKISRTAFQSRGEPRNGLLRWVLRPAGDEVLDEP